MSALDLLHTCPACGAEESLDAILGRVVEDDETRHLVADVVSMGAPLGKDVIRYLRLFKPAKQRLRIKKAREVLGEVLLDMKRCFIERKGRRWPVTAADWSAGFEAVFEAADKGSLRPPLDGNAYLYEVLLRRVNAAEAKAETQREIDRRHPAPLAREPAPAAELQERPAFVPQTVPGPQGPSKAALRMRAQMGLDKGARLGLSSPENDSTEMPAEPDATKGSEA